MQLCEGHQHEQLRPDAAQAAVRKATKMLHMQLNAKCVCCSAHAAAHLLHRIRAALPKVSAP